MCSTFATYNIVWHCIIPFDYWTTYNTNVGQNKSLQVVYTKYTLKYPNKLYNININSNLNYNSLSMCLYNRTNS